MLNHSTVTFAGYLAQDPELRYTPTGKAVANFTVMVNRRIKRKNTAGVEEWIDGTPTRHYCEVWEQVAENVIESLTKGARVLVTGTVETRTWDKDGETRYGDKIRVDEVAASLERATVEITKTTRTQQPAAPETSQDGEVGQDGQGEDPWAMPQPQD